MKTSKYAKIGAASALGLALILGGTSAVQAANTQTGTNHMSALVKSIATRFNLSEADVQKVFDENRAAHEQQMKEHFQTGLKQAVTDGKITQAQADQITAKLAEMETFRQSLQGKTQAEIKTAMEAQKKALDKWITDNNIPAQYLRFLGGPGGHGGRGGHKPMGGKSFSGPGAQTQVTVPQKQSQAQ